MIRSTNPQRGSSLNRSSYVWWALPIHYTYELIRLRIPLPPLRRGAYVDNASNTRRSSSPGFLQEETLSTPGRLTLTQSRPPTSIVFPEHAFELKTRYFSISSRPTQAHPSKDEAFQQSSRSHPRTPANPQPTSKHDSFSPSLFLSRSLCQSRTIAERHSLGFKYTAAPSSRPRSARTPRPRRGTRTRSDPNRDYWLQLA
jgi:hypothetical protein